MQDQKQGSRRLCTYLMAILLVLPATMTAAQERFDIQQLHPLPGQQTNYFGVASARVLEHTDFEVGLLLNYADDPLVLVLQEGGERLESLVSAQLTAHLLAAVGLFDWSELGLDVPVVIAQDGEDSRLVPDAPDAGFGVGDIRVVPRFLLFSTESPTQDGGIGLSLGLMANLWIPTGDSDNFQGEGFRIEPRLALDAAFHRLARVSLNLGVLVRPQTDFGNTEVTNALTAGLAGRITLYERLDLVPELAADIPLGAEEIDAEELPMEALLGLKYSPIDSLLVELAGGTGLVHGIGMPDWRIILGVSYSPPADPDRDHDGYLNQEDGCPDDPEDFDGFEDEDGCSDPDNDGDGIPDSSDSCPLEPEDRDGFADSDGCPDPDNDGDGLPDIADGCPNDPEDVDTWEDGDGCPDPDNDGDGFVDPDDGCPLDPETFNDYQDDDGCPDVVMIECNRIELEETVYFDTDSDVILERSYGMLDQVAEILNSRTDVRLVRVEGHTDSRASDDYNLDLSQRRAESVRRYLISRGVAEGRMVAVGFGETQPIATNSTEEGRSQNRRVELLILQQDGCEEIRPPY